MALHERFSAVFRKLIGRWTHYQDAPRDPERVTELAQARADLDETRSEIAEVRDEYHPDWQREDAPQRSDPRTSVTPEDLAKLRLRGDSFGHRG